MSKWNVWNENDIGFNDESFWEWWEVTDGTVTFKSDDEESATWLCDLLNKEKGNV